MITVYIKNTNGVIILWLYVTEVREHEHWISCYDSSNKLIALISDTNYTIIKEAPDSYVAQLKAPYKGW